MAVVQTPVKTMPRVLSSAIRTTAHACLALKESTVQLILTTVPTTLVLKTQLVSMASTTTPANVLTDIAEITVR